MVKILIVDDETTITENMKHDLSKANDDYKVFTCNSGYDAISILLNQDIDIVITDIAMPDMNGYQLYGKISNMFPDIPVVMMTGFGYDPNHTIIKSKKDGLKDVVFKPFDTKKMVKIINKRTNQKDE